MPSTSHCRQYLEEDSQLNLAQQRHRETQRDRETERHCSMMMLSLPSNCVLPASLAALCSLLAVNMLQMRGGNTSLKSDIERGRSDNR